MATTFSGKMTPIEVDIWLSERIDSINTQIGVGDYTGALQAISDLQNSISGLASEAYVDARTGYALVHNNIDILSSFTYPNAIAWELGANKLYCYTLYTKDNNDIENTFSGVIYSASFESDFKISHAYFDDVDTSQPVFLIVENEGEETNSKIVSDGVNLTIARLTIYEMR